MALSAADATDGALPLSDERLSVVPYRARAPRYRALTFLPLLLALLPPVLPVEATQRLTKSWRVNHCHMAILADALFSQRVRCGDE